MVNSYLYKDILTFGNLRKPMVLEKLVRALALQLGNEVSYNELGQLLGVDKNTVSTYMDILEQGHVVFRLSSFSRNLRNEIKRNQKVYFYDTGIRNAVIGNFNHLDSRTDVGGLWENFLIAERIKKLSYENSMATSYFWRTIQQQEVDYVEEVAGEVLGFEFKWNPRARVKPPKLFLQSYQSTVLAINRENFREFVI